MTKGKYIVSEEHRFVYCVLQKVACSSVKTALAPLFGIVGEGVEYEKVTERIHKVFNASPHQVYKNRLVKGLRRGEYLDYFIFAFVRNPFDRLVSCHSEKLAHPNSAGFRNYRFGNVELYRGMPFAEFVEAVHRIPDEEANPHFCSQHVTLLRPNGKLIPDFVGRFERLEEDFAYVAEEIGAPHIVLPHRLRSRSRQGSHYHEFYDRHTRKLVEERFERDLELFDYSF